MAALPIRPSLLAFTGLMSSALRPPSQVPGMPLAVLPPSSIAARNVGLQILGQSRTLLGCSLPSHSRVEEVVDGTRSVAN